MLPERVAIIGAGMAGLVAALSFARHGIGSDIFEAAPELQQIGAGLQVSPNASRILAQLGILQDIQELWTEPERISLVSGVTLRPLAHVPAGSFARDRWGAPYGVLHRATLQRALLAATRRNPLIEIRLLSAVRDKPDETLQRLTGLAYPLIIGADGVWSDLRRAIPNGPRLKFSGSVAWRLSVHADDAPGWLENEQVTAFVGPSSHLVAYPLREAGSFNIVAIVSGNTRSDTWDAHADDTRKHDLLARFHGWNVKVLALLEQAEQPTFWPLYETTAGRWHNGRDKVLIGDAAHAMTPFAAQGASMAIEDAFVLANRVAASSSASEALDAFERDRSARIAKVRARGQFNRFAYHARGPARIGRDLMLSLRPPQSLAADLDWLYGFDAR